MIPLPELDDRRWPDLVEESRALIPVLAPVWTDHNASDPGVTIVELLAWLAEMDVYRANQVTDAARRRFLSLVGVVPRPPAPSRTVVAIHLNASAAQAEVPVGTELEAIEPAGGVIPFRTADPLTAVAGELGAVYIARGHVVRDLSARTAGSPLIPFGTDPSPGTILYLGFTRPLPTATVATLYASIGASPADLAARARIIAELVPDPGCEPVVLGCECVDGVLTAPTVRALADLPAQRLPLRHHSVELAWEIRASDGTWIALASGDDVIDETRALTLSGRVLVRPPVAMTSGGEDGMDDGLWYVRCRLAAGMWDQAPALSDLSLNGVAAIQAVAPTISADAVASLPGLPGGPAQRLSSGTGRPRQRRILTDGIVVADSLVVQTVEGTAIRTWAQCADFDASSGVDADVVLDPLAAAITFGDGQHGRAVPAGADMFASYLVTVAEDGNFAAGRPFRLPLPPPERNPMLTPDAAEAIESATNVVSAVGGSQAETLEHAEGRALEEVARVTRAVTLTDLEALACSTPGTAIARAAAIAGLYSPFPCVDAAGLVAVVVIPWVPTDRPTPSEGLLEAVRAFLGRRRLIGTRIEVIGPTYLEVTVQTTVVADPGVARDAVRDRVTASIRAFFDPLAGGPDGDGWPLGRDVFRTEVLDVINRVDGVARVEALELVAEGCGTCNNVCIGRTGLVASGQHTVVVGTGR